MRAQDALANLKRKRRVDEDGDDGRLDGRSKRGPGADGSIHRAATGSSSRGERGAAATASRSTRAKSVTTSISSKDDNGPEEEGAVERPAKLSRRARKSAPEEMSSKVRVSVRRKVVSEDATARARRLMLSRIDPRFDPLIVGGGPNEEKNRGKAKRDAERARRDYAFIDELRASEMAALRERVVKTRNAEEKAALKRELAVLESRARERERRLAAERVLEEHKKREKELAKKGKRPFYLKRSEQKKKVLIEQFATMNEKQRDKLIEKKRKKLAAKEKKMEPPAKRRT